MLFTSGECKKYNLGSCQEVCEGLIYLFDKIYIRFGTKLNTCSKIVGIRVGKICAPLDADLFLLYTKRGVPRFSPVLTTESYLIYPYPTLGQIKTNNNICYQYISYSVIKTL